MYVRRRIRVNPPVQHDRDRRHIQGPVHAETASSGRVGRYQPWCRSPVQPPLRASPVPELARRNKGFWPAPQHRLRTTPPISVGLQSASPLAAGDIVAHERVVVRHVRSAVGVSDAEIGEQEGDRFR